MKGGAVGEKLEGFLVLARQTGAAGRALIELVRLVTSEPGLLAFGEILDEPSVQAMAESPEAAPHLKLLQIFAYGAWGDYKAAQASLPALEAPQVLKLKQLTLLDLALGHRELGYAALMAELEIPTQRELEHFLINNCMYADILEGRLDQSGKRLEVTSSCGRDVHPSRLDDVIGGYGSWLESTSNTLDDMKRELASTSAAAQETAVRKARLEAKVKQAKTAVKAGLEAKHGVAALGGDATAMDEDGPPPPTKGRAGSGGRKRGR